MEYTNPHCPETTGVKEYQDIGISLPLDLFIIYAIFGLPTVLFVFASERLYISYAAYVRGLCMAYVRCLWTSFHASI